MKSIYIALQSQVLNLEKGKSLEKLPLLHAADSECVSLGNCRFLSIRRAPLLSSPSRCDISPIDQLLVLLLQSADQPTKAQSKPTFQAHYSSPNRRLRLVRAFRTSRHFQPTSVVNSVAWCGADRG